MSATSGIRVTPELSSAFATAIANNQARFVKVSIKNESLVHDRIVDSNGSLNQDLQRIPEILSSSDAAYLLVRQDDPAGEWLAVSYVPDSSKVRDKMLYASTRAILLKSLGASLFTSSLFATSLNDLTPTSYAAHLKSMAAPPPLSAREAELASIRAAEREMSDAPTYAGSNARVNHIGSGVGLKWGEGVENALRKLGEGSGSSIVVIKIDPSTETLVLVTDCQISVDQLSTKIPTSEPSFAFFAWPHAHTAPPRREIVFIYACPTSSPIKHRMLYSSGTTGVYAHAKSILPGTQPKSSTLSPSYSSFRAGVTAPSTFRNSSGIGSGAVSLLSPKSDAEPGTQDGGGDVAIDTSSGTPAEDDWDTFSDRVRDGEPPSPGSFFAFPGGQQSQPSSGFRAAVSANANAGVGSVGSVLAARKIETSDPSELDEAFLVAELGLKDPPRSVVGGGGFGGAGRVRGFGGGGVGRGGGLGSIIGGGGSSGAFAKPKGPPRRGAGAGGVPVFPS